jgi:hypothetical protein
MQKCCDPLTSAEILEARYFVRVVSEWPFGGFAPQNGTDNPRCCELE